MTKKQQKLHGWYTSERPKYEALTKVARETVERVLQAKAIPVVQVTGRAKSVASFVEKSSSRKRYKDPRTQNTDFAGVRIITYLETDVARATQVIRETFVVSSADSEDKSDKLGTDRVGYRSVHLLCSFTPDRLALPEFAAFAELKFEVQIRTAFQHAWAEIEHDRRYKFAGVLPPALARRLSLVAACLEAADGELDRVAAAIDDHIVTTKARTAEGNLDLPVTSASVKEYVAERALRPDLTDFDWFEPVSRKVGDEEVQELLDFGISSIRTLEAAISAEFVKLLRDVYLKDETGLTRAGFLRDVMLFNDARHYFENAWHGNWAGLDRTGHEFLTKRLGAKEANKIIDRYDLHLLRDDDE